MKHNHLARTIIILLTLLSMLIFSTPANATVTQSKRGIDLSDSVNSWGVAGGIEDQSWAYLVSSTYHYVYAVQEGRYFTSGTIKPNEMAQTMSDIGTWNMDNDDALGGPVDNGTCYPSWFIHERCGRPLYKFYPTVG
ncbi:hypothetical protein [Bifidobacterium vespertilionis]|uniref:hypothetical protein n=1 Tax=Bifidobacterium vespertilionis TaxID=2562524 RepID=UPI001BDD9664|nr:hypothetical protein [Bifidobacterium vespertilionis]MBT1180146.1 hypothetical protein [Bifidobacterium vespertilionis]